MKTMIHILSIVLISTILIYPQISEDTWEIQVDNIRSVEPALAVNPTNRNILVAYMEYSNINPKILYKLFNENGALIASGVISEYASDPDVIFDSQGNAYVCFLDGTTSHSVSIRRSINGGVSFENSVIIRSGTYGNDKPLFTIDKNPNSPYFNRIYVAYTNFCAEEDINIEFVYCTNSNPGIGNLMFSNPLQLLPACVNCVNGHFINGAFTIVNPNNNQVYLFWLESTYETSKYFFTRSLDGGNNFGEKMLIMNKEYNRPGEKVGNNVLLKYERDVNLVSAGFKYKPFPFAVVDATTNSIYLVASATTDINYDFSKSDRFILWKSIDNGISWSESEFYNEGNYDLFMPFINCDNLGRVIITNYNSDISPFDNFQTDMNLMISTDNGETFGHKMFRSEMFSGEYVPFDLKRPSISNDFIGDYIESEWFSDNIYIAYCRTLNPPGTYESIVHLLKLPLAVSTKFENQYTENEQTKNDLGSILINETFSFNSPVQKPIKLFEQFTVEPEESFYDPLKFYKWSQPDEIRTPKRIGEEVSTLRNKFLTYFHQTKPLTVRNYFEGGDGKTISFGEIDFDVSPRNSPFSENAFIYNLPVGVNSIYQATASQSFTNHLGTNWNFVKWENGTISFTREEQININSPAEWKAIYKGQFRSDNTSGISSNSQAKICRTEDGIYHIVYESLEDVWYTRSITTDYYETWTQDVSLTDNIWQAKNPSIDCSVNNVAVVFEYNDDGETGIAYIKNQGSIFPGDFPTSIALIQSSYFGSAKPVVALTPNELFVVYRKNPTEGLKYKFNDLLNGTGWQSEVSVANTNSSSINPSVAGLKVSGYTKEIYIAYQQGTTAIKSIRYYRNGTAAAFGYSNEKTISSGNGYTFNQYPSVSLRKTGSYYYPIVSWTARRKELIEQKSLAKETGYVYVDRLITIPAVSLTTWGSFYVAGDNVSSTNNNSTFSSLEETVIALSTNNGTSSKWLKRTGSSYSALSSLSHSGSQIQFSNGSTLNQLKALAFDVSVIPYSINKITTVFDNLAKITSGDQPTYGRTGVVYKNGVEFAFNFGDILLEDQNILFTERSDTLPILNTAELNEAMRTNNFTLNSSSNLYFSVLYYVINTELADSVLTSNDTVNFKVELVDAANNQTVGIFDNINYSINNLDDYASIDYQVDCNGISSGEYFFRLITEVQNNAEYYLSNVQNDREQLAKKQYNNVAFNHSGIPTEYELAQNYPNPFNPSTTIRYQIPQDGIVTLKIYDILGSEVATLVNEEKIAGKYEVNFNAKALSSGVYIYKIKAGDFVSSKKMLLLK